MSEFSRSIMREYRPIELMKRLYHDCHIRINANKDFELYNDQTTDKKNLLYLTYDD